MGLIKKIARNTGILFISNIISKFFGFLYTIYMARYLGAEGFGIISFALAFTGMFAILADMGLQPLTIREIARNPELTEKYLGNVAVIKLILGIITFVLIVITINLMNYSEETVHVVYLIAFYVLINSFNNMFYSIYQGHEKMEFVGIGNILNSSLMLLGTIIGIYLKLNVKGFAIIYLVVSIILLLYNIIISKLKFIRQKINIDVNFWKNLLKESFPFALSGIFVAIYFWADSIMLSYMVGNRAVGIYNAAYRLVYVLLFIPAIYFTTIYPILSKMYLKSKDTLNIIYNKSLKYFAIIGLFIGLTTVFLAKEIILLIYGSEYIESSDVLKILIWAIFFSFLAHATLYTLNSINRQIIYTKITGVCAILNIILNIFAIEKLSYIGASLTTVFTEMLGFLGMFLYLKYYLNEDFKSYNWAVKLLILGVLSATIYYLSLIFIENIIVSTIISIFLYLVGIFIFKIIDDFDIEIIYKLKR